MARRSFLGASFGLGRLLGIPIRVHFTFLVLLGWLLWQAATRGEAGVGGLFLVLLLFACVVLHELGHAVMARLCRVDTREILLLPIGGLARMDRLPSGLPELLIALAGPAVNLALGLVFTIAGVLLFDAPPIAGGEVMTPAALLIWGGAMTNFVLMGFNLLPAFPMDGGRVLRALLSLAMPLERATRWAGRVGQGIAVLLVVMGFGGANPVLILIGVMVFFGAASESFLQSSRARLTGRPASAAMLTRFESVAPQTGLGEVAELRLKSGQPVFPVVDAWQRLAGVLTRDALVAGIARQGPQTAVLEVMQRDVPTVAPDTPLEEVIDRLQSSGGFPVFVLDDGRLVGMITAQSLAEMMEISRALGRASQRAGTEGPESG